MIGKDTKSAKEGERGTIQETNGRSLEKQIIFFDSTEGKSMRKNCEIKRRREREAEDGTIALKI